MTCRHDDKVDGAEVEAVEHVLRVAGHREAGLVVAEIAERERTKNATHESIFSRLNCAELSTVPERPYYACSWFPTAVM